VRKIRELQDPKSCLNKAGGYEIIFVLRAKDSCAPDTIRDWIRRRLASGKNIETDAQMIEANACADMMEHERGYTF